MQFSILKSDLVKALKPLVFSTYNTSSSSMLFKISSKDEGSVRSCSGVFANKSMLKIFDVSDGLTPCEFTIHSNGFLNFVSSLPSEKIIFFKEDEALKLRGVWSDNGEENYTDQTYEYLNVKIPSIEGIMEKSTNNGSAYGSVLLESLKFTESLFNKESVNTSMFCTDGKMIFIDEVKIGMFELPNFKLPSFEVSSANIHNIIQFLSEHADEQISVLNLLIGPKESNGYAFLSSDKSVIIYGLDKSKESEMILNETFNTEKFNASFEINNSKILPNLRLVKSTVVNLVDELSLEIYDTHVVLSKPPHFKSKLSIKHITEFKNTMKLKVQYSNLLTVLSSFPKKDLVLSIDNTDKRLQIESSLKIEDDSSDSKEILSCNTYCLLHYWNSDGPK
jgi:hypothetical protein